MNFARSEGKQCTKKCVFCHGGYCFALKEK